MMRLASAPLAMAAWSRAGLWSGASLVQSAMREFTPELPWTAPGFSASRRAQTALLGVISASRRLGGAFRIHAQRFTLRELSSAGSLCAS